MFKTIFKINVNSVLLLSILLEMLSILLYALLVEEKDFWSFLIVSLIPTSIAFIYLSLLSFPVVLKLKGYKKIGHIDDMIENHDVIDECFVVQENQEKNIVRYVINFKVYEQKF